MLINELRPNTGHVCCRVHSLWHNCKTVIQATAIAEVERPISSLALCHIHPPAVLHHALILVFLLCRGQRPAPPDGTPDLPIVFQMLNDKLQLFRDLGGGSLHRRGYRSHAAVHKAALNEAAAAGLLLIAGWDLKCRQPGQNYSVI